MHIYVTENGKPTLAIAKGVSRKQAKELVSKMNKEFRNGGQKYENHEAVMVTTKTQPQLVAIMDGDKIIQIKEVADMRTGFCRAFNRCNFKRAYPITIIENKKSRSAGRKPVNRIAKLAR